MVTDSGAQCSAVTQTAEHRVAQWSQIAEDCVTQWSQIAEHCVAQWSQKAEHRVAQWSQIVDHCVAQGSLSSESQYSAVDKDRRAYCIAGVTVQRSTVWRSRQRQRSTV